MLGGRAQAPSSMLAVLFIVTVESPLAVAPWAASAASMPSRPSTIAVPKKSFVIAGRELVPMFGLMWRLPQSGVQAV